jgi:predicted ATPase/DNA-binding XRE family transcriptional regulator
MKQGASGPFGAQLKALREAAGYTQEELAAIAGVSVHAVSALERGTRRRPHVETVRALSAALDLSAAARDALVGSARPLTVDDQDLKDFLPLPLTSLVGRDADVQTLGQWLADSTIRLITLVGSGGVGKTRLALHLAHAIAEERSNRVRFVPLAPIRDPAFVAQTIGEALGLPDVDSVDLAHRARVVCEEKPTLLVLDNFEHVLDAAPLVAELLTLNPSLRVLATSRASLRVRGEREYLVGPLELGASVEATAPEALARSAAVHLFEERVRDVRPDFRLTSMNALTVASICRRLDALPLALELAAPWMKVLTAEDLLRQLDIDVLLSAVGAGDLPERQQTMNATVAWSYQLLAPDDQRAFRRFAALPGLFPIDAAAEVLAGRETVANNIDEALRAAAGLIEKSLLLRAETSAVATCPLYYMLETVRAYAALELAAAGERDEAMEGLVRYCTREASLAAEGLVGLAQIEWLNRVQEDLETYRSALRWLIERDRPAEAAHIAWNLMWFWIIRGHSTEGLRWYQQILEMPSLPPAAAATTLIGAASMWYTQANLEDARRALTRALVLAQESADRDAIVQAEFVFGHVEHTAGNLSAARDRFARSVEGFRAAGNPWGTGHVLTAMAWVALASGDTSEAESLLDQADPVLRDAGPWFLSLGAYIRAILAVRRGLADEAFALVRESLTRIRDLQDKFAFV